MGSNCVLSRLSMFPPVVTADHGVEHDEHLAHEGNGGDLRLFSGGNQSLVEITERGLAAGGGAGRHVKSRSHPGATAGDGSGSIELAAVVIEGGEADHGADGPPRDPANPRHHADAA